MGQWIQLAVYAAGWFACARIFFWKMQEDGDTGTEDRLAAGFLSLFWPFILCLLVLTGVFLLPTLRWGKMQRWGTAVGWAFARKFGQ